MEIKPIPIKISNGFTFEMGNLGKLKDYFSFESNNPNAGQTEIGAFITTNTITKCDSLFLVLIDDVLNLPIEDFYALQNACEQFHGQVPYPSFIDEKTLKTSFGLEINGIVFDLIELGETVKALHKVEAERLGLTGCRLLAYLAGKEVVRLKQSNGDAVLEGQLNLDVIGEMYLADGRGFFELANTTRTVHKVGQIVKDILASEVIH